MLNSGRGQILQALRTVFVDNLSLSLAHKCPPSICSLFYTSNYAYPQLFWEYFPHLSLFFFDATTFHSTQPLEITQNLSELKERERERIEIWLGKLILFV
jgi:hypothetical protein